MCHCASSPAPLVVFDITITARCPSQTPLCRSRRCPTPNLATMLPPHFIIAPHPQALSHCRYPHSAENWDWDCFEFARQAAEAAAAAAASAWANLTLHQLTNIPKSPASQPARLLRRPTPLRMVTLDTVAVCFLLAFASAIFIQKFSCPPPWHTQRTSLCASPFLLASPTSYPLPL